MYSEGKRSWVKHLDFTFLDLLCLELSLVAAYAWRFDGRWLFDEDIYERLAIILLLIHIVVVFFVEPYKGILRRNKFQEFRATPNIPKVSTINSRQGKIGSDKLYVIFISLSYHYYYQINTKHSSMDGQEFGQRRKLSI